MKEGDRWEDEDNCSKEDMETELGGQRKAMISLVEDTQRQEGMRRKGGQKRREVKRRKEREQGKVEASQ